MSSKSLNRVVFYSKTDLAWRHNLLKAEKLLNESNSKQVHSINDLLEFYNIQLYFDNDLFLSEWDLQKKTKYVEIVKEKRKLLSQELAKISDTNIFEILNELEFHYEENFWSLLDKQQQFKKISKTKFAVLLNHFPNHLNDILKQKNIVKRFDSEIKNYLMECNTAAELLLTQFEELDFNNNTPKYCFPKSLTLQNKETIISKYLDYKDVNPNYVRLIENSKDSNDLKLSDKTRYKAQKVSEKLNDEILESGNTWNVGVEVGISEQLDKPVKYENIEDRLKVTYNKKTFDNIKTDKNLFKVFSHIFVYTTEHNLIDLVSRKRELDTLETIFVKSKNEYEKGKVFSKKEMLSSLQLYLFEHYLVTRNKSIEKLINSFIVYINSLISPQNLIFQIRNIQLPFKEKIRLLLPEFDFLLKQFKNLADDGNIDLELLQVSSKPIGLSQIKSQATKKYIYPNSDLISQLKYLFFIDKGYSYNSKASDKAYINLFDLLTKHNVSIEHFEDYQKYKIDKLINDGYLKVNNNHLEIDNITYIYIVRELYLNEVLNYWYYPKFVKDELDIMIQKQQVIIENTLFTKEEIKYFNYHLNKKVFTNGYDIRNKYTHGTNTLSEQEHKRDYYLLLKIIILTLLKIEDDMRIKKK